VKKFLALLLACVLIGAGACATPQTQSPPTQNQNAESPGDVSTPAPAASGAALNTVSMFGGTDPAAGAYASLIAEFESAAGTDVSDSSDSSTETWKASVLTDFTTGNEPDVLFFFNGVDAAPILSKVVSVDTIRAKYPDYAKDIKPAPLATMAEADGKTYAVPVKGFYEAIFVNKRMFEERNIELPTDWAKLETAIKTFSAEGISPFTISFPEEPHYLIESLILSAGGAAEHSVDPGPDVSKIPQSWYDGLNAIKTLADLGAFPRDAATKLTATAQEDFYSEVSPMLIDGSWRASGVIERGLGEHVVVLPFPAIPGGKGDGTQIIAGFSSGFYITQKAWNDPEKQQLAVDFVNHMTSKEAVAALLGGGAGAPAAEIPADGSAPLLISSGNEVAGAASATDMPVDSRLTKEAWADIWSNVADIASGTLTAEQVLNAAIPQNVK
jgi:raffinose/stachyose/melibiose transport system substrate-binding protein